MKPKFKTDIQDRKLLKIIVQIHRWETMQQSEFQTRSGRALYFRIAENLLIAHEKPQQLKLLNGVMSERATRTTRKEFQRAGFLNVASAGSDLRAKQVVATDKFVVQLNQHLKKLRGMLNEGFFLVEKG